MEEFVYKKRIADELLSRKLKSVGAVLVEGPKWCGKTTSCEQLASSVNYISDPSVLSRNQIMAQMNINSLLEGDKPRLLDEWQVIPELWDAVRYAVDRSKSVGQFILTGSAVPLKKDKKEKIHHTGTGRITTLKMRPMSLFESLESNGGISLGALFDSADTDIFAECSLMLEDIAFMICRGGWPIALSLEKEYALETSFAYYKAVTEVDISQVDDVNREPGRVKRLMRSLSRHQGTQVTLKGLKSDMQANDTDSLDEDTVASYIEALKRIFVVEDMPAWNPNLRSKAAIRTSDTRYFVDPSIATASMGVGPNDLLSDLNTMGLLFETMAVRDLRVYADALGGEVYHYRDSNGLECDTVIHLRDGRYGLIEIKLGGAKLIEDGAKALHKLSSSIDTSRMKEPSFKMVLCAVGPMAYRREDGIYVVPVGCLRP